MYPLRNRQTLRSLSRCFSVPYEKEERDTDMMGVSDKKNDSMAHEGSAVAVSCTRWFGGRTEKGTWLGLLCEDRPPG